DPCKKVSGSVWKERLTGFIASLKKQCPGNFNYLLFGVGSCADLLKNVPKIFIVRTGRLLIITDDDIAWLVERLVEIALRIKDQHDIIACHVIAQLGQDLKNAIGFPHSNPADKK